MGYSKTLWDTTERDQSDIKFVSKLRVNSTCEQ